MNIDYLQFTIKNQMQVENFDGLMQEVHNSIASALELNLSCTNPLIYWMICYTQYRVMVMLLLTYIIISMG